MKGLLTRSAAAAASAAGAAQAAVAACEAMDLFHAVNQNGEHVSFSTKQYCELSKQTASTKTGNAWVKGDASIHGFWDGLPEVITFRVQQLSAHIKYVLRYLPWVLGWYMNKPFRMLRFRRYVMAERTFAGICAR